MAGFFHAHRQTQFCTAVPYAKALRSLPIAPREKYLLVKLQQPFTTYLLVRQKYLYLVPSGRSLCYVLLVLLAYIYTSVDCASRLEREKMVDIV